MTVTAGTVVCYPFVGEAVGGSHVSMMPVIQGIGEKDFMPLVAIHQQGPLTRYLEGQGVEFVSAPPVTPVSSGSIPGQIISAARAAPKLASFLRRHGVAIVHTNDTRMHLTWGLAARLAGCKFVWHQRSANPSRRLGQYSRLAHAVLTISEFCRRSFTRSMTARATVIREPFDIEQAAIDRRAARHNLAAELGVNAGCPLVGYVGNLTPQKRPLFFIDIASAVRDRLGLDVRFAIAGEKRAPLTERVENAIAAHGLEEQCRLLGPRYPIEPMIAACDVLVAPAKSEGLGRTLVEAMLVGTPVVASDDAGHREVITNGETGLLAAPEDSETFADIIVELLKDCSARTAIAQRARIFARAEFSTERHLAAIASVYRELIGVA